ncbi:MAG: hypothetical protein IT162_19080 [Bryobacterales bacterium]|nr:hypothetical protein [Bryobacterales bacterium]
MVLIALLVAAVIPAFAQEVGVPISPSRLTKPQPIAKPEPVRRVAAAPLRICQLLLSTSPAERLRGYGLLGVQLDHDMGAPDVSYRSVNLDADPDPESILVVSDGRTSSAYIFDAQSGGGWSIVGEFDYSWHWIASQAERFLTLQPLVSDGMDILIRIEEGGTNVRHTDLSIYHLLNGRLYRTFQMEEANAYDTFDTNVFVDERAEIEVDDEQRPLVLIVRRRSDTKPKLGPEEITTKRTCAAWRWNPAQFRFVAEPAAAARALCTVPARVPRARLH